MGASIAATQRDKSFDAFQSYYNHITSTSNIITDQFIAVDDDSSSRSTKNNNKKEELINTMVTFMAEGIGKGGLVRIKPYNIIGIANNNVKQGETVQVQVLSINSNTKQVRLLLI